MNHHHYIFYFLMISTAARAMEPTSSWQKLTEDEITQIIAICGSHSRNQLMRVSRALRFLASKENEEILRREPLYLSKQDTIYYLITSYLKNNFNVIHNLLRSNTNPVIHTWISPYISSLTQANIKDIVQNLLQRYQIKTISLDDTSSRYILAVYEDILKPGSFFIDICTNEHIKQHYPPMGIDTFESSILPNRNTLLYMAAYNGYKNITRLLLTRDSVDINRIHDDFNRETALYMAAMANNIHIIKLLLTHSDINVNAPAKNGVTTFHAAAICGNLEALKLLYEYDKTQINNKAAPNLITPLYYAAFKRRESCVEYLLTCPEIDANVQLGNTGYTPLHIAVHKRLTNIIKLLLKHPKININVKEYTHGYIPFHLAAAGDDIETAKVLVTRTRY